MTRGGTFGACSTLSGVLFPSLRRRSVSRVQFTSSSSLNRKQTHTHARTHTHTHAHTHTHTHTHKQTLNQSMMIFFSGPNDKITSRYAKGGDVSYGLSMTIDARKGSREQTCFQTLTKGRQRRSRDHVVPGECSIWWPATAKARQPTAGRPTQFDGRRQTAPADDWS